MIRARSGFWIVAGTPTSERYPCMCGSGRCNPRYCPCWGRPDVKDLPAYCCAPRYQPKTNSPTT